MSFLWYHFRADLIWSVPFKINTFLKFTSHMLAIWFSWFLTNYINIAQNAGPHGTVDFRHVLQNANICEYNGRGCTR
jgi:hypothetical protein